MKKEKSGKVKRGEIYLYDFGNDTGSIQGGTRPALVIQCEAGNEASTTTIVAAITTAIKKENLPPHIVLGKNFGLRQPSMVMLEQIRTVNQDELKEYIGFVSSSYIMNEISVGLKKTFGLWIDRPEKKKSEIRCLCPGCMENYKANPNLIVRRMDPLARPNHKCDKCGEKGYEYVICRKI